MKRRWIILILAILGFAAGAASAEDAPAATSKAPNSATSSDARPTIPAADVQRLIAELGSGDYRVRETAMQKLIAAGPQAVDAVAKGAQTDDLEVTYRSVAVLQSLLGSNDAEAQQKADEALEALAAKKTTVVANLANDALALYQTTRQDRALERMKRLGGTVGTGIPEVDSGMLAVKLTKDWRGRSTDLALLKQMPDLQKLTIVNMPLDETALKTLGQLTQLAALDLYSTGISDEAAQNLYTSLPGVKIDRRNGALLGVEGFQGINSCRIHNVVSGSAADAADVRADDEIVSFEGQPVHTFEDFTALVSAKKGGEHVKIEVRRGDQVLSKDVTLGKWQ